MGRDGLAVGKPGKKTVTWDDAGQVWIARCRIRDGDGRTRQVQGQGTTEAAAKRALNDRIKRRGVLRGSTTVNSLTRLSELADRYFALVDEGKVATVRSPTTARQYRQMWRLFIDPHMGELRLNEITVEKCEELLTVVRQRRSANAAKIARAVFNVIVKPADKALAFPMGVNPMRSVDPIVMDRRKPVETVDPELVPDLLQRLRNDEVAVRNEIPELVTWMIGTGDRIGNALAADWSYIDLMSGTAVLRGVVVNEGGNQLIFGTSKGNERDIDLPQPVLTALQGLWLKRLSPESGLVFPGRRPGRPRDIRYVHHVLRQSFDRAGFTTLKPHAFRRTTATELERAGLSDHEIAAYLGHDSVETTRRSYIAKRERSELRRAALGRVLGGGDPTSGVVALHRRSERVEG